jgi:transcriptional regulator of arginine metabolism
LSRRERHGAILRLIAEQPISTQTQLAQALHDAGYDVVQTTVSRDVHELGLIKVRDAAGRLVYAQPGAADHGRLAALAAAFDRWALTCESSGNVVLVMTPPGYASPLAQAIDESHHPHVLGTVAGENTVLLVAREPVTGAQLADELRTHLLKGAA